MPTEEKMGTGETQPNRYEVYIPSSNFRNVQISHSKNDKHVTEWAHFEMTTDLKLPSGVTVTLASEKDPPQADNREQSGATWNDEGPRITRFGDKKIAAWDLKPSKLTDPQHYIKTTKGGLFSVPGKNIGGTQFPTNTMCTELASWDDDGALYVQPWPSSDPIWRFSWCHKPDGTRSSEISRQLDDPRDAVDKTSTYTQGIPYWNAKSWGVWYRTKPQVRTAELIEGDDHIWTWTGPKDNCFQYTLFESSVFPRPGPSGPVHEFRARTSMRQTSSNFYKGEYVNKHCGMRLGGYAVASYGGKVPPCFAGDSVDRPWADNMPRRVMDLGNETGNADLTVANGRYELSAQNNNDNNTPGVPPEVDLAFAVVDAAILLSQQYYLLALTGPLQAGIHTRVAMSAANNEGGHNTEAIARTQGYYIRHEVDGTPRSVGNPPKAKTVDGTEQEDKTDDQSGNSGDMTVDKTNVKVSTGLQFSIWLDIALRAQLTAKDTAGWKKVHQVSAKAKYIKQQLNARQIRVNLYNRPTP